MATKKIGTAHGELVELRSVRDRVSPEEWQTRVDLAACYRLVFHFGWHHLILNHISARVPGEADHYLLNPFGLMYDEVTASNLVKVDLDMKITETNPDWGYLLFVYQSRESRNRENRGSISFVQQEDGNVRVAVQLPEMPSYHEQLIIDKLRTKLSDEHGAPPQKPKPKPAPDEDKPDDDKPAGDKDDEAPRPRKPDADADSADSTGRLTLIISFSAPSRSPGLIACRPTQPYASASLTKSGSASEYECDSRLPCSSCCH